MVDHLGFWKGFVSMGTVYHITYNILKKYSSTLRVFPRSDLFWPGLTHPATLRARCQRRQQTRTPWVSLPPTRQCHFVAHRWRIASCRTIWPVLRASGQAACWRTRRTPFRPGTSTCGHEGTCGRLCIALAADPRQASYSRHALKTLHVHCRRLSYPVPLAVVHNDMAGYNGDDGWRPQRCRQSFEWSPITWTKHLWPSRLPDSIKETACILHPILGWPVEQYWLKHVDDLLCVLKNSNPRKVIYFSSHSCYLWLPTLISHWPVCWDMSGLGQLGVIKWFSSKTLRNLSI